MSDYENGPDFDGYSEHSVDWNLFRDQTDEEVEAEYQAFLLEQQLFCHETLDVL